MLRVLVAMVTDIPQRQLPVLELKVGEINRLTLKLTRVCNIIWTAAGQAEDSLKVPRNSFTQKIFKEM